MTGPHCVPHDLRSITVSSAGPPAHVPTLDKGSVIVGTRDQWLSCQLRCPLFLTMAMELAAHFREGINSLAEVGRATRLVRINGISFWSRTRHSPHLSRNQGWIFPSSEYS